MPEEADPEHEAGEAVRFAQVYRRGWLSGSGWRNLAAGGLLAVLALPVGALLGAEWQKTRQPLVVVAAAPNPTPSPTPSPSPSPYPSKNVVGDDRVLSLWTRAGTLGHACPISSTDALTADHVAVAREVLWGPDSGFAPFALWGDVLGNSGTVQWQWSDRRRDLSLVRVVPDTLPFSAYLRRAQVLPRVGDKLYVVGFKWGRGAGDWTNEVTVTGSTAGALVYDKTPGQGSSGSCVLNASGEFVAINVWRLGEEGLGLLVIGEWASVPDQFLEGER